MDGGTAIGSVWIAGTSRTVATLSSGAGNSGCWWFGGTVEHCHEGVKGFHLCICKGASGELGDGILRACMMSVTPARID